MRRFFLLALLSLVAVGSPAPAHYNMLLPQTSSAKKDEPVTVTYQWGHPFEHQLFDAPLPERVVVLAPDGKVSEQTNALEKITLTSGEQKVTAYRFQFTPALRGDYVVVLKTPPIWMKEDGEFLQDTVKVVVHVQAQKEWDQVHQQDFEFTPLTRPYGLQAGMAFQARILHNEDATNKLPKIVPLAGALVEIERYNAAAPKTLPPDEQITRTVKTDPNGVATCTLTEPGWWCLTAGREAGVKQHEGKNRPVRQRSTFWVLVDEKPAQ